MIVALNKEKDKALAKNDEVSREKEKIEIEKSIIEKEKELFKKASIVNQARLHSGYHYPRSVATARMSDDNKARFTADHKDFINFEFQKFDDLRYRWTSPLHIKFINFLYWSSFDKAP